MARPRMVTGSTFPSLSMSDSVSHLIDVTLPVPGEPEHLSASNQQALPITWNLSELPM